MPCHVSTLSESVLASTECVYTGKKKVVQCQPTSSASVNAVLYQQNIQFLHVGCIVSQNSVYSVHVTTTAMEKKHCLQYDYQDDLYNLHTSTTSSMLRT